MLVYLPVVCLIFFVSSNVSQYHDIKMFMIYFLCASDAHRSENLGVCVESAQYD